MNRSEAIQLIRNTFERAFAEDRFRHFTRELLNEMDESKAFSMQGAYIPEVYRGHVRQYKRLATYTDPQGKKIDVLVVHLRRESSLERARTMQRNFVAHYLKKRGEKDAALVAYYTDGIEDWRFSWVHMEYQLQRDEASGKVKVVDDLTPARRYSFLVGAHEPNHTAQQQLFPILADDRHNPTLAQLEAAFDIESVTREFFAEYKELFLALKAELDRSLQAAPEVKREFERRQIDTATFAKKLLGQIVFLYFLQKKGWLGVEPGKPWGSGPKNFLRRLYAGRAVAYDNFFRQILEPLFYEALAEPAPDNFYPRLNCRIPFLNGGLFDPLKGYDWRGTDLRLPNELFGRILDVFDRYNFTVREDEPLEKEVAVDPEMLGKVFENLLEVRDRKSKGAFYTPREIVHYMCQESLIQYLDTALNGRETPAAPLIPRADLARLIRQGELALHDELAAEAGVSGWKRRLPPSIRQHAAALDQALADIRLCDPAIGSGAFAVGMMQEIVRARQLLTAYLGESDARTAYNFKRQAIQESIYGVDLDPSAVDIAKLRLWLSLVVDEESYDAIQPLPNLDYKIVQGNSLDRVEKNLLNLGLFDQLDALKRRYFDEIDSYEKIRLRAQIDQLIGLLTNGKQAFDFEIYFHEVFEAKSGFDVVIGNPPYVRQERLHDLKPQLKANFPQVYAGTADLYAYFYAQGMRILRDRGVLAFISSNKFMRAGYGKKLRAFLAGQTTLHSIIDFGDLPVFAATAYPSIVITQKQASEPEAALLALNVDSLDVLQNLPVVVHDLAWPIPQKSLRPEGWALVRPQVRALMEKLRRRGMPLAEFVDGKFYYGIKTGYNQAFVIDAATRQRLIEADPRSAEVIKPWLRGKDIKRWRVDWKRQYLLYIPWEFPLKRYPAIQNHLQQHRLKLEARPEVREGRFPWYALSRYASEYVHEFGKPKIVYPHFNTSPNFAFEKTGALSNDKTYIIPDAPLYLLGLLNSRVVHFVLSQLCPSVQQGYMELRTIYVGQIPVPAPNLEDRSRLESLVRKLVAAEGHGSQVAAWERELNEIVYRLYDLTDEEIALIEESKKFNFSQRAETRK